MSAIIDQIVAVIRGARYGRDVRESIAHGIEVIDDVAEGARDSATASATDAQNYAHSADQSASNAHTSEVNASASATTASQKATLSESWAVGGTGTRTGEDTNNAKYWSEQAQGAVTGVISFNGRIGAVVPTSGDYSITQIDGSGTAGKVAVTDGNGHMVLTDTGQANGIASLDGNGRVPYTQLPESAMEFKGTWNASTNTPTLTSGVGDSGDFYVVSVGGTWNNIDFNVNDRIIFDGVTAHDWIRLVAGEVNSVNGQTGVVSLGADDIPFNNTGTTISSTDTEAAIKEVFENAGTKVIPTSMADYLAHKSEYDATSNMYQIDDAGVANSAGNVSYDNTNSDLESVTVQGAIDEINSNLTNLLSVESTNKSGNTIPSNDVLSVVMDVSKTNKTPLGIVGITTNGSSYDVISRFFLSGNNATIRIKNATNSAINVDVLVYVLYKHV